MSSPCPHSTRTNRGQHDTCTLPHGHSGPHTGQHIDWTDRHHGPDATYQPAYCPTCRTRKADS